ncbi:AAA family ATPase [Streptomyces sp. NPDC020192]|uniref:helix-turn-helix transcriptional regulator n=1 Tax=Streptomyces sp. NPDC020192 TaxID=3365066 RepID=UPI00378BB7FB
MEAGIGMEAVAGRVAPLVGRDAELAALEAVLAGGGERGTPSVVDVTGEAGIGKSRLLSEVARRARQRGFTVLRGRATEYERHLPFQPFTDAFADLDPRAPEGFAALADAAPVLYGSVRSGVERFRLHRATAALLSHVSGPGLLLVLDDLHWADPASWDLLDHLVRHPAPGPVVLLVARRARQSPAPLAASLTRGVEADTVLRLDLGPLPRQACAERLAPDLAPAELDRLHTASEGNPLYLLALLHAHRTAGTQQALPAVGLTSLLLEELSPLAEEQLRALETVAILGDQATPALVRAVSDRPEAELLDDLGVLARRDLLRSGPGDRLALRHPVLRSLVHDEMEPWRRAAVHRRAAAALARTSAAAAEQAHHVERALTGWDPDAAGVLVRAARQTARTAPASSAHWWEAALRHLPHTAEHAGRRRGWMLERARALGAAGRLRDSRDLLHEVIALAQGPDDASVRVPAVVSCADMERHLGRYAEAVALLRRELERRPGPAPADVVALGRELGSSASRAAAYGEVRATVVRALAAARSLGDEVAEAGVLAVSALGEAYEGDMAAARRDALRAAALVDALPDDDLTGLCEPLARLAWAETLLEAFADAGRHADRGLAVARCTGQVAQLPYLLLAKAHIGNQTGELRTALEQVAEAEDVARGLGSDEALSFVMALKAQVLTAACPPGDPAPVAAAREAVAVSGPGVDWWASTAWSVLGYTAFLSGDPEGARDLVLRAGGPGLERFPPSRHLLFLEILVRACLALGDLPGARAHEGRAREIAGRLDLPLQRALALRISAQFAVAEGRPGDAAGLLTEAAAECERSGARFWEAYSLLLGAPLMAASPRHAARAGQAWRRGRRLALDGGAAALVGLADATRNAVLGASDRPAAPLAGLTAREREIATLVAEGLTGKDIAAKLVLSTRTVETHLSRIYRKTGVSSRTALAALVPRPDEASGPHSPYQGLRATE